MLKCRGFSLLEMIVAIGIFAVIATISFATLNRFLDDQALLEQRLGRLTALQQALTLIEQDMHYPANRPVRDGYGDEQAAIIADSTQLQPGELIRLTASHASVSVPGTSTLSRVSYRFEDGELLRVNWPVLDRDQDTPEIRRLLMGGLLDVRVQLFKAEQDTGLTVVETTEEPDQLPDAIEWSLMFEDGSSFRRIFEVRNAG